MKYLLVCLVSAINVVDAFHSTSLLSSTPAAKGIYLQQNGGNEAVVSRESFLDTLSTCTLATVTANLLSQQPASARGGATLFQSFERYGPRVRAGGAFYGNELRGLVQSNDWEGIKSAVQEPPKRQKSDLQKPDAGVSERAKQAGGFSDARVLVAADLLAAAFSDNSISAKTKKMQGSVAQLREIVADMETTAKQALGEDKGGLFGIGAKKPSQAESSKKMRQLYVQGGSVWNEYIFALNDELAEKFDKFPYIK